MTERTGEGITPIFVSVKDAAQALAVSPWIVYRLCEDNVIASHYQGRRRLVSVDSLKQYAKNLPTTYSKTSSEGAA